VDDVLAIVKKQNIQKVQTNLSAQFPSINFTSESEVNGKLPFLDVLISREGENLKFSIYRKPTSNQQFIPEDSHHSKSHKMAAFNSMFHRLFSIEMSQEDFEVEQKYIMDTGRMNGYSRQMLDKIFEKHKRKKDLQNLTSLQPLDDAEYKYISMPFCPPLTHRLDNQLRKHGYKVAYKNDGKLSDLLGSTKDKIREDDEKSGIYQINCSKCDASYIGQTKRKMKIRIKEHFEDCSKPPIEEKPMPKHAIENNHPFGEISLLKEVRKPFELNAYESLLLNKHKNKNLVNIQKEGNCPSTLYKFV
jgi:hypothetical protein